MSKIKCKRCYGRGHYPSETCDSCVDCNDPCMECNQTGALSVGEALDQFMDAEYDIKLCKNGYDGRIELTLIYLETDDRGMQGTRKRKYEGDTLEAAIIQARDHY